MRASSGSVGDLRIWTCHAHATEDELLLRPVVRLEHHREISVILNRLACARESLLTPEVVGVHLMGLSSRDLCAVQALQLFVACFVIFLSYAGSVMLLHPLLLVPAPIGLPMGQRHRSMRNADLVVRMRTARQVLHRLWHGRNSSRRLIGVQLASGCRLFCAR